MPRPLAGFFIAREGDIRLHLAQYIADGRRFQFLAEVNWDWFELQQDVFEFGGYNIPYIERDIDACHERIGILQKMHAAASLTPAMRRRLEAQTRLLERELAEERLTIDHAPQSQEEMSDEPRAPAGQ